MGSIRWGVMGTGGIAGAMTDTLAELGSPVVVVGSGRPGASADFAAHHGVARSVASHDAVAAAADVDVVYVATTNDQHYRNVMECVRNGKAVLCEKPLALNARQARQMSVAARDGRVFMMEAMWMSFLPFLAKVHALLGDGAIGEPTHVQSSFSFPAPIDPTRRWLSRERGGGALLDLGIYPLTLVHHLLGPPRNFAAKAHLANTGVDINTTVISHHRNGSSASVMASFNAATSNEAIVAGTEARIRIHAPFYHSRKLTLERDGDVLETFDTDFDGHGFRFEVAEVERCLAAGKTESELRPHAATIAVLDWMDAIRAECGVVYQGEED